MIFEEAAWSDSLPCYSRYDEGLWRSWSFLILALAFVLVSVGIRGAEQIISMGFILISRGGGLV
jgi:hypothetical protein